MVVCKGRRSKRPRAAVFGDSSSGGGGGSPASSSSRVSNEEDDDVAHCLMLLSRGGGGAGGYECKTCCRRFPSFQALGGHRASHNKKQSTPENQENQKGISGSPSMAKSKIHGCSICGSEFFSGQALGGHMRRHRPLHMNRVTVSAENRVMCSSSSAAASSSSSMEDGEDQRKAATGFTLDLNLPAPHEDQIEEDDDDDLTPGNYVFSGGPGLVECHN
ncbi:hypothetical protein DM860_000200 [Cuscuta australis]|uniref:C2H2-type domain-containing protein n=1 Tax=Cuscuta australis TaxID=267555 RepID=A0A328CWQ1_9ASTE|nr:hypothetical protein DM860_000200 [Cuscuta australis]